MEIEEKLEAYADLLEKHEQFQSQMQELIAKVPVPKEVTEQWNAIKAEYQPMIDATAKGLEEWKSSIEADVLQAKATVKTSRYMAVWNKGRSSWDGKKLEGFAMAYPEILQAQKIGEPTVTFRKVK